MEGNQLWQTPLGTESDPRRWGSSSSPILFEDVLIVTASAESEALVGLDTKTGQEVWRKEAAGLGNVWGTPVLAKVKDRTDVVLGVPFEVWGFDPKTGKFRWYCEAVDVDQFSTSIVASDGMIYAMASSRGGGGAVALRPGGEGDVSDSAVVWSGNDASRFASPIVHDGLVYAIDGSIARCFDATTGKRVYQSRLSRGSSDDGGRAGRGGFRGGRGGGGSDFSSPVMGDGKIYYVNGSGSVYVLKGGEEFEQLAVNKLGDGSERFSASPAISDGSLFVRSTGYLYRVGK